MADKLISTRVCKKERKCGYCGRIIKVGETYRYRGYDVHKEGFCLKCKPFDKERKERGLKLK
jgi:hypothetical protein